MNMDDSAIPIGVSAMAGAIARQTADTDELVLLGALFTQLGDTLSTIAALRQVSGGAGSVTQQKKQ